LTDVGLRAAVVQFRDLSRAGLSTVFWLSAGVGAVLALALSISSRLIADFAHLPALSPVLVAISCGLFFSSICAVPLGLMNLKMEFRKTAIVEMVSECGAGCAAIGLALHGFRYWALVGQNLTATAMACLLYFAVSGWRPSFAFDLAQVRRITLLSTNMLGFNALNYWARSLDTLLIGRYLGSGQLGYYNRAYSLMMYPYSMLHTAVTPVLHSALSSMQHDLARMRQTYLKLAKISLMISLSMSATFAMLAKPLVVTIWGAQWLPSVPVFRLLCVVAAIQPILAASGSVYIARNRADLLFKLGAVYIAAVCAGFVLGLHWGILGVAAGYAVANLLVIPPTLGFIVLRLLEGRFSDLLRQAYTPVLCALAGAACAAGCDSLIATVLAVPVRLFLGLLGSGAGVAATACVLDMSFVKACIDMLPEPVRSFLPCHETC
jgi:PST family polysaccharide transporter